MLCLWERGEVSCKGVECGYSTAIVHTNASYSGEPGVPLLPSHSSCFLGVGSSVWQLFQNLQSCLVPSPALGLVSSASCTLPANNSPGFQAEVGLSQHLKSIFGIKDAQNQTSACRVLYFLIDPWPLSEDVSTWLQQSLAKVAYARGKFWLSAD